MGRRIAGGRFADGPREIADTGTVRIEQLGPSVLDWFDVGKGDEPGADGDRGDGDRGDGDRGAGGSGSDAGGSGSDERGSGGDFWPDLGWGDDEVVDRADRGEDIPGVDDIPDPSTLPDIPGMINVQRVLHRRKNHIIYFSVSGTTLKKDDIDSDSPSKNFNFPISTYGNNTWSTTNSRRKKNYDQHLKCDGTPGNKYEYDNSEILSKTVENKPIMKVSDNYRTQVNGEWIRVNHTSGLTGYTYFSSLRKGASLAYRAVGKFSQIHDREYTYRSGACSGETFKESGETFSVWACTDIVSMDGSYRWAPGLGKPTTRIPDMNEDCCGINRRIWEILGGDEFPFQVPQNIVREAEAESPSIFLKNYAEVFEYNFTQDDARWGQWTIPITVEDADPTKKGKQRVDLVMPNLAEAVAELFGLSYAILNSAAITEAVSAKTLMETGLARLAAVKTGRNIEEMTEFLGYGKEKDETLKLTFNPESETVEEMLKPSEQPYKYIECGVEDSLQKDMMTFLDAAKIIRSCFSMQIPKGAPEQMGQNIFNQFKDWHAQYTSMDFRQKRQMDEIERLFASRFPGLEIESEFLIPQGFFDVGW